MKLALVVLVWAGTVVAAFLLGGGIDPAPPPDPGKAHEVSRAESGARLEIEERDRQIASLREQLDAAANATRIESPAGMRERAAPGAVASDLVGGEGGDIKMDGAIPSLEGIDDAAEFSALMMRFVDMQLARGADGHLALIKMLGSFESRAKDLQRLFADESQMVRHLYPWVRFLVQREDKVVDFTESVYRTMAENPTAFEGLDDDPFEGITEGLAMMLPAVVDDKRLDTFRGYAKKILETPEESQPDAIRRSRSDIKRTLERFWSTPITPEEALAQLKTGQIDAAQAARLLKSLKPEQLQGIDVTALLLPMIGSGDYRAIQALKSLPAVPIDHNRLDGAVLDGLAKGNMQYWFVSQYLPATGRDEWIKARPFFDSGFALGDKARIQLSRSLGNLPPKVRPDKPYVEDLLRRYEWSESDAQRLKRTFGIE